MYESYALQIKYPLLGLPQLNQDHNRKSSTQQFGSLPYDLQILLHDIDDYGMTIGLQREDV